MQEVQSILPEPCRWTPFCNCHLCRLPSAKFTLGSKIICHLEQWSFADSQLDENTASCRCGQHQP